MLCIRSVGILLVLVLVLAPSAASASPALDPPASPPPCDVILDPLFCIRITGIEQLVGQPDAFRFELEFVNWTRDDAAGLVISLNSKKPVGGLPAGAPCFSGASTDRDGRPLTGASSPPAGNVPKANDWSVVEQSESQICFGAGTPIPGAQANGFFGLLDPAFSQAGQSQCIAALTSMIPGSVNLGGNPAHIAVPDAETIDDGPNVLDGFVITVKNVGVGDQFSFNWHFVDAAGDAIGVYSLFGAVMGDEYGFGTLNFTRFTGVAPSPLFLSNTGYDPQDDSDPDADHPRFWAEDEVAGVDTYAVNPIPAGLPGQGTVFAVEPGAAVTAFFANNALDNLFFFAGLPVFSGFNANKDPDASGPAIGPGGPGILQTRN